VVGFFVCYAKVTQICFSPSGIFACGIVMAMDRWRESSLMGLRAGHRG
jgi:hypothetical protein